jgi:hypothetical protein
MTRLSPIDREALERALARVQAESEEERDRFDRMLGGSGWQWAAESAAYHCQIAALKLKPWQAPPAHVHGDEIDPSVYGCKPGEVALKRRLLAAGLSRFEPDPLGALERAESVDTGMRA